MHERARKRSKKLRGEGQVYASISCFEWRVKCLMIDSIGDEPFPLSSGELILGLCCILWNYREIYVYDKIIVFSLTAT